jgi:hypothetical protein
MAIINHLTFSINRATKQIPFLIEALINQFGQLRYYDIFCFGYLNATLPETQPKSLPAFHIQLILAIPSGYQIIYRIKQTLVTLCTCAGKYAHCYPKGEGVYAICTITSLVDKTKAWYTLAT